MYHIFNYFIVSFKFYCIIGQCCLSYFFIYFLATAIDCWVCTSSDAGCGESINEETLQDNLKTASGCMGCSKTFKSLGTSMYRP